MKTIEELKKEIEQAKKDLHKQGVRSHEYYLFNQFSIPNAKLEQTEKIIELIDKMSFGHENKGRFSSLQQLKDAIQEGWRRMKVYHAKSILNEILDFAPRGYNEK